MSKLDSWLNSKVSDNTLDKYTIGEYSLRPYYSKYDEQCYYIKNDSDMEMNDKIQQFGETSETNETNETNETSETNIYNDHIFLYPNTNRYHANYLFRQLVDVSYDNNFNYTVYNKNGKNIEHNYFNLIDVTFKETFYQFCHDNTLKLYKD